MKTNFKTNLMLCAAVLFGMTTFSQSTMNPSKKSNPMEQLTIQAENKKAIRFLYDSILNTKKLENFSQIISTDYTNSFGNKGIEGFQKSILELTNAFPDAHWEAEDVIAEGNKVIVKQKFTGTHSGIFQNIEATNNKIAVNGITTYELKDRKIIFSQVQTDRYSFLQQLGQLPTTAPELKPKTENQVYFIDQFSIPEKSIAEFLPQMNSNRNFVKVLPGYIKGEAFQHYDKDGNLILITVAVWENQDQLNKAKTIMQAEFKKNKFNPAEFNQRLKITMKRGEFNSLK